MINKNIKLTLPSSTVLDICEMLSFAKYHMTVRGNIAKADAIMEILREKITDE
jgi:hypothetical protein